MKTYEIQIFRDGTWKIDSVFDNRDLALFEARRVEEGNRYAGVRVVEETYDEASDLTTTRTIFRGSRADRDERAREAAVPGSSARAPAAAGELPRRARQGARPTATSFLIPILILSVLVIAGLAALFGLQQQLAGVG